MRNGTPLAELTKPAFNSPEWFNASYPIVAAIKYPKGLQLIRENLTQRSNPKAAIRKQIKGLSRASLKRLAFLIFTTQIEFQSILTLTYGSPPPMDGRIIKRHLSCFLVDMNRQFGSFDYLWWLEFQGKRRAPHYHLLLTLCDPSPIAKKKMARLWAKWSFLDCPKNEAEYEKVYAVHSFSPFLGSEKKPAWEKIREKQGALWYILKYASKHKQKTVPKTFSNPGRFWGKSGNVASQNGVEIVCTEMELRDYLSTTGLSVTNQAILPKRIITP